MMITAPSHDRPPKQITLDDPYVQLHWHSPRHTATLTIKSATRELNVHLTHGDLIALAWRCGAALQEFRRYPAAP